MSCMERFGQRPGGGGRLAASPLTLGVLAGASSPEVVVGEAMQELAGLLVRHRVTSRP